MPSSKGYSPQRLNPQRILLIREVSLMSPALTGGFFTTSSILPLITPLYHYQYSQLYFSVLKRAKPTEMLIEQYKAYKYCILLIQTHQLLTFCHICFNFYLYISTLHHLKVTRGDFPGGPVVKTPCFQCRGCRFDPRSGNQIPHAMRCSKKKKLTIKKVGFPGGASCREPAYHCRRHKRCRFHPWVRKIP